MRLILLVVCLVLGVGVGRLARPTLTLQAFAPDGERLAWRACSDEVTPVVYTSMNSIYRVPVREEWAVTREGVRVTRVVSAPRVLDYYGIEDYRLLDDGQAVGRPGYVYPTIKMKLTELGDQRLSVAGRETRLWDIAPAGALDLRVVTRPWLLACW